MVSCLFFRLLAELVGSAAGTVVELIAFSSVSNAPIGVGVRKTRDAFVPGTAFVVFFAGRDFNLLSTLEAFTNILAVVNQALPVGLIGREAAWRVLSFALLARVAAVAGIEGVALLIVGGAPQD